MPVSTTLVDSPGVDQLSPVDGALLGRGRALRAEVKALASIDLAEVEAEELAALTLELHATQASMDALVARSDRELAVSGRWAVEGAASAAAWLASRTGSSKQSCGRSLRWGRALEELPALAEAWQAGEVCTSKVGRMMAARNPRTEDVIAEHCEMLVGWAKRLRYPEFDRLMTEWSLRADPDGPDRAAKKRDVYLAETAEGMFMGAMTLDPVGGAIVSLELQRLEQQLFDADWAEAKRRLRHEPVLHELARTPGQRRADALVEMARRSAHMPPDAKQARILLSLLIGPGPFAELCEIEATHRPIPPGAIRDWLDAAIFERIMFDGPDRVMSVSHRRSFPEAVRRAIQVRDRSCTGDGGTCDTPAPSCDVDHVEPYTAGGLTCEANGEPLCDTHNTRKGTTPGTRLRPDRDRYLHWLPEAFRRRRCATGPDPPNGP